MESTTLKVGIMGYSAQKFNAVTAEDTLSVEFLILQAKQVEIVSGLTDLGIPGLAYKIAKNFGFTTVGIACSKAVKYPCFPCDKVQINLEWLNWGDESPFFLDYCDQFIQIGGGEQSFREAELARQMGKEVIYHQLAAL